VALRREWTDGAFPVLDPRGFYSTSGACSVSPFTTMVRSSFRRRRQEVCVGLQLRGATEWDEPGTFIFELCCQRCGPRPPHGPAAGPAIRPQPGRVSPGVTRRPRAVRSGRPSEGGEAEVPQRIGDLQDIVRTNRAGQGASLSRRRPMTRWRECSRTAAKALRRRLTEPGVMCYKSPGGCWRRPSPGRGHSEGLYQAGPNLSSLAARPAERFAYN